MIDKLSKTVICWGLFFISQTALADHVMLKNGDNLTGNIQRVQDGKMFIKTDYSDVVVIESPKIKSFSITEPVKIKSNAFSPGTFLDSIGISDENHIVLVTKKESKKIPITDDLILVKKSKPVMEYSDFITSGSLNFSGYYDKTTKKTVQYTLDSNLAIKHDAWRHRFYASLYSAEVDLVPSTHYYTTQYDVDGFFNPSVFWQGSAQYKQDWISNIKSKFSVGIGPGWQIWEDELSSLSLAGLLNYQIIDYRASQDIAQPTWLIKWNYQQFLISKHFKLYTLGQIGRGFTNNISLDFSSTAGVVHKFTNWLAFNISVTKEKNITLDGTSDRISYNVGVGITW